MLAPEDNQQEAKEEAGGGGRLHKLVREASKLSADPLTLVACMDELRAMHKHSSTLEWERELSSTDNLQRTPLSLAFCGGNTEVSSRGLLTKTFVLPLCCPVSAVSACSELTEVSSLQAVRQS